MTSTSRRGTLLAAFRKTTPTDTDTENETGDAVEVEEDHTRLRPEERHPSHLAMSGSRGHLTTHPGGVTAWFGLGEQDVLHKSARTLEQVISSTAHRWAALPDKTITLRVTQSPFPARAWAERMHQTHPNPPAVPEGARSFADNIDSGRAFFAEIGARRSAVVVGVQVTDKPVTANRLGMLLQDEPLQGKDGRLEPVRAGLTRLTERMSGKGFDATPISNNSLRWLTHASAGMGAPVPPLTVGDRDGWDEIDTPGFTAPVVPETEPLSPHTKITTMREGRPHTTFVTVLAVASFINNDTSQPRSPWLAWTQSHPFGVEVVVRGRIIPAQRLRPEMTRLRQRAVNIAEHYREHGDTPPKVVEDGIKQAMASEDELGSEDASVSSRFRGVILFAVAGDTPEEVAARADILREDAAQNQGMILEVPPAQHTYQRAFIPCEPFPTNGYITQLGVRKLAGGIPNGHASGGDLIGMPIGNIGGGHDVFCFGPLTGSQRNKSGVVAVISEQGGGKSHLFGALADWTASSGVRTVVNDPGQMMQKLADLPWHRNNARVMDLTAAQRGTLNPGFMVVDPVRADHESDEKFAAAFADAEMERRMLFVDTFRDMLPLEMIQADPAIMRIIRAVCTEHGTGYGADPWKLLDAISREGETGRQVAQELLSHTRMRDGALIFPEKGTLVDDDYLRQYRQQVLTIVTMGGLQLPPKDQPDRTYWSEQQRMSLPIVNLASRFTTRMMYSDYDPKVIINDELGMVTGGAGGFGPFLHRASIDTRKRNAMVAVAGQTPNMFFAINDEISTLLGSVWCGRMDLTIARRCLPLLGAQDDDGIAETIAAQQQGDFMVRHWDDNAKVRQVGVSTAWWHPELLAALDTTPGGGAYKESLGVDLFGGH